MLRNRTPRMFTDRIEAGRLLAERLRTEVGSDVAVLGLTRGGMPVAYEVARGLAAPLDMIVVARLGVPWRPEATMGALAEGGVRIIVDQIVNEALVSPQDVEAAERHERARLAERVERLRGDTPPLMLGGRTVVIVDDGIVTGTSARAACEVARRRGATHIVVAVPVASEQGLRAVSAVADDVIALQLHEDLVAIGQQYLDFDPTDDDDVAAMLLTSSAGTGTAPNVLERTESRVDARDLVLEVGTSTVDGWMAVPDGASELVIVAHDSSRERFSARSRYLARILTEAGFAVLQVDLLTRDDEGHGNRFLAIRMLAERLRQVTRLAGRRFDRVNYVADGVATAIVLEAAAQAGDDIHAIVCLGGRPDLAPRLGTIRTPVLFVVGEHDSAILGLNRQALPRLTCPHQLKTVPGAGHRFREPGALKEAAADLLSWLQDPAQPAIRTAGRRNRQRQGAGRGLRLDEWLLTGRSCHADQLMSG